VIKANGVAGALAVLIAIVAAGPAGAGETPSVPATPASGAPTTGGSTSPVGTPVVVPMAMPIVVTWVAPEGCPSADTIRSEVRRMAGPAAASADAIEAHATVRREHGGNWQLTLTTRAGALEGERKLSASDCAELGRAAALVIALMINTAAEH